MMAAIMDMMDNMNKNHLIWELNLFQRHIKDWRQFYYIFFYCFSKMNICKIFLEYTDYFYTEYLCFYLNYNFFLITWQPFLWYMPKETTMKWMMVKKCNLVLWSKLWITIWIFCKWPTVNYLKKYSLQ